MHVEHCRYKTDFNTDSERSIVFVLLPVRCDLSSQLLPNHRWFWVSSRSTVKHHVRVLFGDDVFGTFNDSWLHYNNPTTGERHTNVISSNYRIYCYFSLNIKFKFLVPSVVKVHLRLRRVFFANRRLETIRTKKKLQKTPGLLTKVSLEICHESSQ